MAGKLALAALLALLAALAAGWLSAHAGDPADGETLAPLTLHLEADNQVCTAGSFTEVRWEISGGATPYAATLNGQPVDTPSGAATIPCGTPLNIPDWLRGIVPPAPVDVGLAVVDASEAEAHKSLRLNRAPPLPAPVAGAGPEAGWTYLTTITAYAHGTGVGVGHVRRYLVRWRADGAAQWNYHTDLTTHRGRYDQVLDYYETGLIGARIAVEVAQVRSFAEQEKPDLLHWSETSYMATASPPTDLTAHATHDTITVSWGPAVEGLAWTTTIGPVGDRDRDRRWLGSDRSTWTQKTAGPGLPYEVSYDELLPDTLYHIRVMLDDNCDSYGWHDLCTPTRFLSVRTAPAPADWLREPRQPQNLRAIERVRDDGILVTWDPPIEGKERAYAVFVHEYGALRLDPVTPVGGVGGRSYVLRLPLDTTYQVIVQHLGVEDEEARVIWEPRPTQERTDAMTLPNWGVEYREPTYAYGQQDPGYEFAVLWDAHHEGERVQVRWLKDGYVMTQSARTSPLTIRTADPGPHPFQLRIQRRNSWSQWSSIQRASAKPPTPPSVEVRERDGMLEAFWTSPETWHRFRSWDPVHKLADQIDGFRAYLYRAGESERVLDVGSSTSAQFPISADGGDYEIHVAAYNETLGEGRAAVQTFSQADGPVLNLSDYEQRAYRSSSCIPYLEEPKLVRWQVEGGAAPYTIKIGENSAFETTDHEGYGRVHCDPEDTRDEAVLEATVVDAYGRTDKTTHTYQIAHPSDDDVAPESAAAYWRDTVEGLALGRIYVETDSFVLRWNRFVGSAATYSTSPGLPLFVVRWREIGQNAWSYRHAADAGSNNCRSDSMNWRLEGLRPDTEYEVQVALDPTSIGIIDTSLLDWSERRSNTPLDWSESRFARTLPATIDARIRQEGADVVVSWRAVPEAQRYVVRLEADGVRWAKRYEPQGNAVEEAVFTAAAAADAVGVLRAEVAITSGISADPGGVEIEDYAYCD